LEKELKNLQELESTLDLFGSHTKKISSESFQFESDNLSKQSPVSLPKMRPFVRNLAEEFDKAQKLSDQKL
jgi:hypothetical protein